MTFYIYGAIISALGKGGEWEKALELFQEAKDDPGIKLTGYLYGAIISALGQCGEWEKALELFKKQKMTLGLN